jgi:hypothetical protein
MISFVKKATNFISLLILKSKVPSIMFGTNRLVTILGANILDTNIRLTNLIWQPR